MAPVEIIKCFGEGAVIAKECEIAYNATFMALLWDTVATRNAKLLEQGIRNLPGKLDRATWLNYVRCHDDIGLGFDDVDVIRAGYDPRAHRRFLIDYFTGRWDDSLARGQLFGHNEKSGDSRISGSLASLAGLETALERQDEQAIGRCIDRILLLHGMIMSFGGIPLLYYGDEIGTFNDFSYMDDEGKAQDTRWIHRPVIDWDKAERRHQAGTPEQRIFDGLRRMIAVRQHTPAFADFNNRELISTDNPHLFAFMRSDPFGSGEHVLVVANFDESPQALALGDLGNRGSFEYGCSRDLCSGEAPTLFNDHLVIPPFRFYWLASG